MELVYTGKTKNVFKLADGNYLLKFKDDVTGTDGVFDPGSNTIGLTLEGAGRAGLKLTKHFFEILKAKGIPTHYIDANIEEQTMTVQPATVFGKGQELPAFVEVTLKDDEREDPPITKDALAAVGLLTLEEYEVLKANTQKIAQVVKAELKEHDIDLYDIKFEFGRVGKEQAIVLIDEISGGNMRAYKHGEYILPLDLEKMVLAD
ncbi:MAG: phosphoribosylaminoimidazolesuccinocarboxamide synthase [Acidaminococcaceae bacterium]